MQAAGDLANLVQHLGQAVHHPCDHRRQCGRLRRRHRLHLAQGERERDEPLLDPVLQVALEPPPGFVRGRHDPRPRRGELRTSASAGSMPGRIASASAVSASVRLADVAFATPQSRLPMTIGAPAVENSSLGMAAAMDPEAWA